MIIVIRIEKKAFDNTELPILFHEPEFARCYYFLVFNNRNILKFSAQSEIEPMVKQIDNIIAVGIDQSVGFWNIQTKKVMKIKSLTSFFYEFYFSGKYIFIVCEVDIIVLKTNTLIEYKELSFNEYIDHIEVNGNNVVVSFIDGKIEIILI